MGYVLNNKSNIILKNDIRTILLSKNENEIHNHIIITPSDHNLRTIIFVNTHILNDIISIILEYFNNDITTVSYKVRKTGSTVWFTLELNNFHCDVLCAKDKNNAVKSLWFKHANLDILECHSMCTQGISFINYFMDNVHNIKYFLQCGSEKYKYDWTINNYDGRYMCKSYDIKIKVNNQDELTTIIRMIKIIIEAINIGFL